MNINRRFTRFAMVCVATSFSTLCAAQSEPVLEEIMVTATKRATTLQDTPLAISAFSGEKLHENHVSNIFDLRGMVPSLQIRSNGDHDVPLIFIRGQGTIDQTEAGDGSVAFYTDGVFAARAQGTLSLMYDLERVEALRGPQGTLFGRNSTAGAISIHTAKPIDTFDGAGSLRIGSRQRQEVQMMLNTPLTDSWAVRFAAVSDEQIGETQFPIDSPFVSERPYGTIDRSSFRASSLFTPSDNLEWFLSFERYVNTGTGDVPTVDPDNRVDNSVSSGVVDLRNDITRSRIDYNFSNGLAASYILGLTDFTQTQRWGGEREGNVRDTVWSFHEATQHEFQLKNSDDSRFRWTVGAFFFEEDNGIRFDIPHGGGWGFPYDDDPDTDTPLPPPNITDPLLGPDAFTLSTFIQPDRSLESTAFYAQGTFDITDTLRITLGARNTSDERADVGGRSIDCTNDPGRGPLPTPIVDDPDTIDGSGCFHRQINDMRGEWDNTSGMASLEWDLNDDILLFASFAQGWKSGVLADGAGPRLTPTATQPIHTNENPDVAGNSLLFLQAPEENESFEIGVKSTLLDGRMRLNANLFFMDYTDMQVTSAVNNPFTGMPVLTKTNAGSASIDGIEVEMSFATSNAGLLEVTGTWLDATYDEFIGSEGTYGNATGRQWNPCAFGVDPNSPEGNCAVNAAAFDFSGNTLPNAPELALSISYLHDIAFANGAMVTPRIRLYYQDDMFLTQENRGDRAPGTHGPDDPGEKNFDTQEAYTRVDLSLTYASANAPWSAELYVNNATDEAIKQQVDIRNGVNQTGNVWAPSRESGVRFSFNFE